MKNTNQQEKTSVFQLAKTHLYFAVFRLAAICALAFLFYCKNKIQTAFFAVFLTAAAAAEIAVFFIIYAKTFAGRKRINFPHYMLLVLETGALASFVNYFGGGNLKNTLFIAGATATVSAFYFITFLLKQKIAEK